MSGKLLPPKYLAGQLLLLVRLDCAVAGWVCNACQHKACVHLIVIKESLLRLVNLTGLQCQNLVIWSFLIAGTGLNNPDVAHEK